MPKPKSKAFTRIRAEVLRIVASIPPGYFTTYGTIAVHMNVVPLHVGSALASLTEAEAAVLPWHRVVGSDARLSKMSDAQTAATQRARLEAEGMKISKQGVILDSDAHFYYVGPRRSIRWSAG
jgi:methylated-DNA-protein-cysteine methyltransferase-like protein